MTKRKYALGRGEAARLELEWQRGSDMSVALDGVVLTSLRAADVDAGVVVPLPDGSSVFVRRMPRSWWSLESREPIRAERLGAPLPGSDWDPRTVGRRDAVPIAGLGVLFGGFVALWGLFRVAGNGGGSIAGGVLVAVAIMVFFIVLAVLAALGRRFAVAVLMVPVFAAFASSAGAVVLSAASRRQSSFAGLIVLALCVARLVRAWTRMGAKVITSSNAPDRTDQDSGSRRDRARA